MRTSWASYALVLAILGLSAINLTQRVSAVVPVVQNVVVFSEGGSSYLNITVSHTPEIQSHYVDKIEVTFGSNTTALTIGVQQLRPDDTFIITYDAGPIAGTPTTTVRAHCTVNGWSTTNWTGTIPEFSTLVLFIPLLALTSLVAALLGKSKRTQIDRSRIYRPTEAR